jgi:lysophospholipase L1-like esterase
MASTRRGIASRIASLVGLVGATAVACACPPPGALDFLGSTTAVTHLNYVAMGDSVAAAPGVPDAASPAGCHKSTNDYPSVLARRLNVSTFTDVSCSGAATEDIASRAQQTRDGRVPRQIDAVTPTTDLVTITIGANDIGLAADAQACQVNSPNPPPCTNEFVVGNVDSISRAITTQLPLWSALIDWIRLKAPNARIIMVGYGIFVRPGGCFPGQPVLPRDSDYLQSKLNELDDRQQQLAGNLGIDYFDTRPLSRGHDICAAPSERYIEGFRTTGSAVPLHPNAFGATAVGNALSAYLAGSVPRADRRWSDFIR